MVEYKKNIEGHNIRYDVSPWTGKITIELDNETIYTTWELSYWVLMWEILTAIATAFVVLIWVSIR